MEELAKLEAERGNPEYLEEGNFRQRFQEKTQEGKDMRARRPEERTGRSGKTYLSGSRQAGLQGNGDFGKSGNRRASNEMCIFLILNISSLQLIPVNMIAYRSQYGSTNPTAIIAPAIAATLLSTLVAIVYCKIKDASTGNRAKGSFGSRLVRMDYEAATERKTDFRGGKAV